MSFSADGQRIVTSGGDGTIRLWDVETGDELRSFSESQPTDYNISANGKYLIVSTASGARIFDADGGREIEAFPKDLGSLTGATFLPGGRYGTTCTNEGSLRLWHIPQLQSAGAALDVADAGPLVIDEEVEGVIKRFKAHPQAVTHVLMTSGDREIVSASSTDRVIRLWNPQTLESTRTFDTGESSVAAIAMNGDGDKLFSGHASGAIIEWELTNGKQSRWSEKHPGSISSLAIAPDGKTLATTGGSSRAFEGSVRAWDVETGREKWSYELHKTIASSARFSADGRHLFAVVDQIPMVFDAQTGQRMRVFDGRNSIMVSSLADRAVTFDSGAMRLWNVDGGVELGQSLGMGTSALPRAAVFSPDGRSIVSATADLPSLRLWNAKTMKQLLLVQGSQAQSVMSLSYFSDGTNVVFGQLDGQVGLWTLPASIASELDKTPAESAPSASPLAEGPVGLARRMPLPGYGPSSPVVSADGSVIALAQSPDGRSYNVKAWNIESGEFLFKSSLLSRISGIAISDDGSIVVTRSESEILIWDVATGKKLHTITAKSQFLAIAPDVRKAIVTLAGKSKGDPPKTFSYDLETGQQLVDLSAQKTLPIFAAAYSPDGRMIALMHAGPIKLIDADSGDELRRLGGHVQPKKAAYPPKLVFSKDGSKLYSLGADATIRSWDVASGKELQGVTFPRSTYVKLSNDGRFLTAGSTGVLQLHAAVPEKVDETAKGAKPSSRGNQPAKPLARVIGVVGRVTGRMTGMVFVPGTDLVVTTADDATLRFWRLPAAQADAVTPTEPN
jgi:WD40 repeat protein